ncbi:hypothetical protein, partial [Pontibacter ummariensis]|uniref:hypothetical protein n=1 Tax=Pontibacter ummariensis TaxID=1610492 RepID=UPI001C52BCAE
RAGRRDHTYQDGERVRQSKSNTEEPGKKTGSSACYLYSRHSTQSFLKVTGYTIATFSRQKTNLLCA